MEKDTKTIKFRSSQDQLENYPENYGICQRLMNVIGPRLAQSRLFLTESLLAVYSYFEKGCRKKCARDNPER